MVIPNSMAISNLKARLTDLQNSMAILRLKDLPMVKPMSLVTLMRLVKSTG